MGSQWKTGLFFSHLLQLLLSFQCTRAQSNPLTDLICEVVNCGFGTCTAANNSLLPFDCECLPGWKKMEIGPVTLPPCVLPNCTLDFHCGNDAPPSPPRPRPPPPPPDILLHFLDPCSYTFCGDGTCVRTEGSGYMCKCNEGSTNLLNMTGLACIKQCTLSAECNNLGFGTGPPPPPPSPHLSEAPISGKGGAKGDVNFPRDRPLLTALLLLATIIPWL